MFGQGLDAFIDVAKDWDGYEQFIPSLEKFKETFLEKCQKTYKANASEFGYNVLNHADFHQKNLLFKQSADETIEDFCIVSHVIVSSYFYKVEFCLFLTLSDWLPNLYLCNAGNWFVLRSLFLRFCWEPTKPPRRVNCNLPQTICGFFEDFWLFESTAITTRLADWIAS